MRFLLTRCFLHPTPPILRTLLCSGKRTLYREHQHSACGAGRHQPGALVAPRRQFLNHGHTFSMRVSAVGCWAVLLSDAACCSDSSVAVHCSLARSLSLSLPHRILLNTKCQMGYASANRPSMPISYCTALRRSCMRHC